MPFRNIARYAQTYTGTNPPVSSVGVATNASWTGEWINIDGVSSIGVQVVLTGTSAPEGTWGADISMDEDKPTVGNSELGATSLTLTSDMTAQNPAGDSANINFLFQFDPAPRAKWFRFKYTRTGGGSASQLLRVGINGYGAAP